MACFCDINRDFLRKVFFKTIGNFSLTTLDPFSGQEVVYFDAETVALTQLLKSL